MKKFKCQNRFCPHITIYSTQETDQSHKMLAYYSTICSNKFESNFTSNFVPDFLLPMPNIS